MDAVFEPKLETSIDQDPLALFRHVTPDGEIRYSAGYPTYEANFWRDGFIAGILAEDAELLESQLLLAAQYQGTKHDPLTGEKPGKIPHEMPGATLPGRGELLTTYNANDTSALYLIAAKALRNIDTERFDRFFASHANSLRLATMHIMTHVKDGIYWEYPPEGADRYALRVTKWTDSRLSDTKNNKCEPRYPIAYALDTFIAANGLLSAAMLFDDDHLADISDTMFKTGIAHFMREDTLDAYGQTVSGFTVYEDGDGPLQHASSDELHALAFIPQKYQSLLPLEAMRSRAKQIETPYGYMCVPLDIAEGMRDDDYHADVVWVMVQAMIHRGAIKFGLNDEATIATNISPYIGDGQELFSVVWSDQGAPIGIVPRGNPRQLWSVTARMYFTRNDTVGSAPTSTAAA